MRHRLAFVALALGACTANPPAPLVDAGGGTDAFSAPDMGMSMGPDTGLNDCTPACTGGTICCPQALTHQCLMPTAAGACPIPDLSVDQMRATQSAHVVWSNIAADDCVIMEGCVTQAGWRRLLLFDTFTPNVGTGDFHMGAPQDHPDLFEYSMCHMHYHFNGYANYTLIDSSGAEAAHGHKQAFCLEDSERVDTTAPARPTYDCSDQGIARGWGDLYYAGLPCQWVDVTDVPAGNYTLRIDINGGADAASHPITELSYTNNTAMASVTIPADDPAADPTVACTGPFADDRDCGWTNAGTFDCTAGATVTVGCGGGCGVGSCHGDPIMRICPDSTTCTSHNEIGYGDDECGAGGNYCPGASFTCPTSGHYTVLTAPFTDGDTDWICTPAAGAHF
jgi:hypothetical protein